MDNTKTLQAQTQEEARQLAIDWQTWQSKQVLSYAELIEWQDTFTELANRYDLQKEFKENGII